MNSHKDPGSSKDASKDLGKGPNRNPNQALNQAPNRSLSQDNGHKENGYQKAQELFAELLRIIAVLRSENGCPWDREQTHESITKNMIEEAGEAVEAIELHDVELLKEELGDVLLQVVLHAQIACDEGEFTIDEVLEGINRKLVRRHPHVFGDEAFFEAAGFSADEIAMIQSADTAEASLDVWARVKLMEKSHKINDTL